MLLVADVAILDRPTRRASFVRFCYLNRESFCKSYQRMISYWNCFTEIGVIASKTISEKIYLWIASDIRVL
jgi:hypothetical protein